MELKWTENAAGFERAVRDRLQQASAATLNNLAFGSRKAVIREMKTRFRDPEPLTLNSVLVRMADAAKQVREQSAEVYIRDDVPGASTQPVKYLLAEEAGGERSAKRSERVLQSAGLLQGSQQWTPGPGMRLDSHGQPSGSGVAQALSAVRAFGQMGFAANATSMTTMRMRRQAGSKAAKLAKQAGLSAAEIKEARRQGAVSALVTKSGTSFFLAKSKISEGLMGIFKLVGRGKITPVMWFTTRRPGYRKRFPFHDIVQQNAKENSERAWLSALRFVKKD